MTAFEIQITDGCLRSDIEPHELDVFEKLFNMDALEEIDGLWRLKRIYRTGRLYLSKPPNQKGFIEANKKSQKDLVVEIDDIGDANSGDIVVVKRIIARRGRASAKVVLVISPAHIYSIGYTHRDSSNNFNILNIKTALPTDAFMEGMDLKALKLGTVLKIDDSTGKVLEILGNLDDPKVDEKISLALFNRRDEFEEASTQQAKDVESEVDADEYENRVDLRDLDFCTIDPVTAKDFDDAIYFEKESYTLYVAIADVSHYVDYYSPIDKEAKLRAFTTYLPHKSFPMLPRELSENICSLKPKVDRLAFVAKIKLDKNTLLPIKEEFFEAIIHSKRRFNYNDIDKYLNDSSSAVDVDKRVLEMLIPLYKITQKLKKERLKSGFDFRSEEIRISIDKSHNLKNTTVESSTPSHSLIEECMLLANKASAKRLDNSIFRIHEPPQLAKLELLLEDLVAIGILVSDYEDSPSLIRAIQKEANRIGLEKEVDAMIIKSLKQASYDNENRGHFGLGFTHYSHFTSPIRRYSDLILHRLIKADINRDEEENEYLLRNIKSLCARVSSLERESTKAEWDFRDRKFARWAETQIGNTFDGEIIELNDSSAKALLISDISGVVVNIKNDNFLLFDKVKVEISEVNIASTDIMGISKIPS
ncbi:3'-to-5' exoribonuclease RNase R [hydrothermal vent metagenome]|uniref:exoribonuclease II n=1 Tax=hydrothermal vent metagenome TaxID=652676 RepID=A0A1W1EK23_9ZZZZ